MRGQPGLNGVILHRPKTKHRTPGEAGVNIAPPYLSGGPARGDDEVVGVAVVVEAHHARRRGMVPGAHGRDLSRRVGTPVEHARHVTGRYVNQEPAQCIKLATSHGGI